MNSAKILISVLNEDINMGSQTLIGEQKQTSYSPDVFLKKLTITLDGMEQFINGHIADIMSRNHVPGYMAKTTGLPFEGGHLYLKDIEKLRKTLQAYKELIEPKTPQTTVRAYAFYYYYLQSKKYIPLFENHKEGKMKAIIELTQEIGISEKSFQLNYNKLPKDKGRYNKQNMPAIEEAIKLMGDNYPKAVEMAKDELKHIELYFSNPIT